MMRRRTFIKLSGLSAVGAAIGSIGYRVGAVWWDQTPSAAYKMLSEQEARIVASIADAIFPGDSRGMPNGATSGVVEFFDDYLDTVDTQSANLLRLLLHALDEISVASGGKFRRFHLRDRADRLAILAAWDTSAIAARRSAFQTLKFLIASGYCENNQALRAAGIEFSCGGMD